MIKNYLKWYILLIFIIFSMIVIPFSFSKYTTTLSKALTLNIESIDISYFKEYNGSNDFLGFDKTDITSFERNTTLTKEEVLEKENVQLISSEKNDEYKSSKEIYGWVEDNHFYWWSEAKTVYFHPKTLGAFRAMPLETVDLTGTNTSKVENFANWFANDQSLVTINGKINTSGLKYATGDYVSFHRMFYNCFLLQNIDLSEFDTKNATNMNSMFNSCYNLIKLNLSNFNTSKVIDMFHMFDSCKNLKELDLSNFNTSKVTSMFCMFNSCKNLKELDLSNFDTSKVTNMNGMFSYCNNLKELDLSSFDTSNVTNMSDMFQNCQSLTELDVSSFNTSNVISIGYMFSGCSNLNVIYSKNDFDLSSINTDDSMFKNNSSLIGQYGTEYETAYDANHIDSEYARISNENQSGYFTYYESIDDIKFNITYDLDGGILRNKNYYYYGSSYTLNMPKKEGYFFMGWTGSNGDTPEKNVTIPRGSKGNKHYVAHYVKTKEFNIPGPCTFNGSTANITGENCKVTLYDGTTIDYTNGKYIDTGIYLFSEENKNKDFEIRFTIDSVNNYTNQATIINSMYETSPWPGFVFRINTANNAFELRGGYNGNKSWYPVYTSKDIVLKRENNKLYYSVDGGDLIEIVDYSNYSENFDIPVTIGASLTSTGTPQRYFKGTLSKYKGENRTMKEGVTVIKNYLKWYILLIFIIFSMIIIPFSFSKYTTTLSKALTLNIESIDISYFKEYNGSNDFLGFDKTDITSFERNTTLTKEEVLEKENVQLISSEKNDEYKSSKEIYGWVEDNHFYWWSEAKTVYFHPKTLGAFRAMYNLETVDLTGTNTSKVENFANWFANDQSLATINGKINTSGLKYQLGSDVSFYRMFFNCFQLQNIDLSEFDTKNATNMSSMFYHCQNLIILDLSNFDTRNVTNMNSMFDSCYNLIKLNVSNFNTSNVTNMYGMFSSCKNLIKLDVSNFNTSKVTDMAGMFNECTNLKELDLSNFDTSNVTNMRAMFNHCYSLLNLNLSNFNTSKVTNMEYMFNICSNLTVLDLSSFDISNVSNVGWMFNSMGKLNIIVLGENFNIADGANMNKMFSGAKNLKIIYAKNNFNTNNVTDSSSIFSGDTNIIGGYGTEYKTIFDKNHIDVEYAKISKENQSGYFTYYESIDDIKFNITYDLDGGTVINKDYYYYGSSNYTLNSPTKEGFKFVGWTGSNGNSIEKSVTIEEGEKGNKHYIAHYIKAHYDELKIIGPCTFNGSEANITGDNCKVTLEDGTILDFTNDKYIDTGIKLFSSETKNKDFEIRFTIDSVNNYTNQATIINSMYETSPWPGFVFRINTANNAFELRGGYNGNKSWYPVYTSKDIVLKRENNKLYYSVDGGDLIETVDYSNYSENFDIPVTIGASLTSTGTPQRYFKGTLSNISIKLGE